MRIVAIDRDDVTCRLLKHPLPSHVSAARYTRATRHCRFDNSLHNTKIATPGSDGATSLKIHKGCFDLKAKLKESKVYEMLWRHRGAAGGLFCICEYRKARPVAITWPFSGPAKSFQHLESSALIPAPACPPVFSLTHFEQNQSPPGSCTTGGTWHSQCHISPHLLHSIYFFSS